MNQHPASSTTNYERFAARVLEILHDEKEWSAATCDDISACALDLSLAGLDSAGRFKPCGKPPVPMLDKLKAAMTEMGRDGSHDHIMDVLHDAATDQLHDSKAALGIEDGDLTDDQEEEMLLAFKDGFWSATTPEPCTVTLEVRGGVAEVTDKPEHVTVNILDHDNLDEPPDAGALQPPRTCILTGAASEDAGDCTTHAHEPHACEDCGSTGWLMMNGDSTSDYPNRRHPHIQKCDMCDRFDSDEVAQQYVLAMLSVPLLKTPRRHIPPHETPPCRLVR